MSLLGWVLYLGALVFHPHISVLVGVSTLPRCPSLPPSHQCPRRSEYFTLAVTWIFTLVLSWVLTPFFTIALYPSFTHLATVPLSSTLTGVPHVASAIPQLFPWSFTSVFTSVATAPLSYTFPSLTMWVSTSLQVCMGCCGNLLKSGRIKRLSVYSHARTHTHARARTSARTPIHPLRLNCHNALYDYRNDFVYCASELELELLL